MYSKPQILRQIDDLIAGLEPYARKKYAYDVEPVLERLSVTERENREVMRRFIQGWRHNPYAIPKVEAIYRIHLPWSQASVYQTYQESVEAKRWFNIQGYPVGNEQLYFHGTKRECLLGDNGHIKLCESQSCSLCLIMKRGFDISRIGAGTGFLRFGSGIYTTSTSSKANDYSQNSVSSPRKAMLLNKVIVGNGKKLYWGDPTLTAPPPGFDSVIGEPAKNGRGELNYDELVVYSDKAIIPAFLIIYTP
ncbi:ADP-ribosylation [Serendipita vermifera]|nr:ADP-ribosylation [Serendipita vermifera]